MLLKQRKLGARLMAAVLVLCLLPCSAFADEFDEDYVDLPAVEYALPFYEGDRELYYPVPEPGYMITITQPTTQLSNDAARLSFGAKATNASQLMTVVVKSRVDSKWRLWTGDIYTGPDGEEAVRSMRAISEAIRGRKPEVERGPELKIIKAKDERPEIEGSHSERPYLVIPIAPLHFDFSNPEACIYHLVFSVVCGPSTEGSGVVPSPNPLSPRAPEVGVLRKGAEALLVRPSVETYQLTLHLPDGATVVATKEECDRWTLAGQPLLPDGDGRLPMPVPTDLVLSDAVYVEAMTAMGMKAAKVYPKMDTPVFAEVQAGASAISVLPPDGATELALTLPGGATLTAKRVADGWQVDGATLTADAQGRIAIPVPDKVHLHQGEKLEVIARAEHLRTSDAAETVVLPGKDQAEQKAPPSGSGGGTSVVSGQQSKRPPLPPSKAPLALERDDHFAYVAGYPDGTIRPDGRITRAEVAAIFTRLLNNRNRLEEPYRPLYSDVMDGAWYTRAVLFLGGRDIIKGYPDGTFGPNRPMTRAEFAALASRFIAANRAGHLADARRLAPKAKGFSDVGAHWAASAIDAVRAEGWIGGYPDGSFRPDATISRAEAVSILNEMLDRHADTAYIDGHAAEVDRFADLNGHWARYTMLEAASSHDYHRADGSERWTALRSLHLDH